MKIPFLMLAPFLLMACDNGERAYQRSEEIETFADPQIQAYEKAQAVQSVLDDAADKQRKAIE